MPRTVHALFLAVALASVGFTAAHAVDESDLPNAVENAKTPADHEAIAVYWDKRAAEARATAARHRQLAAIYAKHVQAGGIHTFPIQMRDHCDALVKQYEQAAQNFDAMAAAHRAEAKVAR